MSVMADDLLAAGQVDELSAAAFTYGEVGGTRGPLPEGYLHLRREVVIGRGRARFEEASEFLMSWGLHRRSGLRVQPSNEHVAPDAVALLRLGPGVLALRIPVRVVYVVDEVDRQGFAYGTLPGHPECGEEAFIVRLREDGTVTLTITAFSTPASVLARLSGPVARALQHWMTRRYLRALQDWSQMLSDRALSYGTPGVTTDEARWQLDASSDSPGYARSVCLGLGPALWESASTEILRWGVKTRSGFSVDDPGKSVGAPVVAGRRYWLIAHLGPFRIREPVEVVAVIDEADRKGFAYGTLTGHPVSGEEMFAVDRRTDGSVWLTVRSVTGRPTGRWLPAYPLALVAQRFYRRRYLRALAIRG